MNENTFSFLQKFQCVGNGSTSNDSTSPFKCFHCRVNIRYFATQLKESNRFFTPITWNLHSFESTRKTPYLPPTSAYASPPCPTHLFGFYFPHPPNLTVFLLGTIWGLNHPIAIRVCQFPESPVVCPLPNGAQSCLLLFPT